MVAKARLISFAVFFLVLNAPGLAQEDACKKCRISLAGDCDSRYTSFFSKEQRRKCRVSCLASGCKQHCSKKPKAAVPQAPVAAGDIPGRRGENPCETCIRRAEQGKCMEDCRGEFQPLPCRQRCAKRRCVDKCPLPANQSEDARPKTQRDCRTCRRFSRTGCASKCGHDKERPGYVACEVSCVEERCLEACNPNLF